MCEKPPIGLRPEFVHLYHSNRDRLIDIADAISRYAKAGRPIPKEWAAELERRLLEFTAPRLPQTTAHTDHEDPSNG